MAAPWCSQLCSPGSSWLCSEHWLMFWVNWSCLSLQSCTLVLTGVFTWVFMTVQNPGWCSEVAELHLHTHSCVHLGLHDSVQNPDWCSEVAGLHFHAHSCVHLGLHDCVQKTLVDVLRELIRSVFAELHLGVHGWLCCQGFTWVLAAVLFTRVSWVFTATHRLYVMCLPLLSQACIWEHSWNICCRHRNYSSPSSLGVPPSWGGVRHWLLCGKGNTC